MSPKVSIGLLLGSSDIPWWLARSLEEVERETSATIEEIVVPSESTADEPEKGLSFYIRDIRRKGCWAGVAIGQKLGRQLLGPIPELEREPVSDTLSVNEAEITDCALETRSSYRYAVPPGVVETLEATDIVIHWGIGILTGDVLDAPTDGVWGIHHGNVREYRGGPPGFWEYLHGRQSTAVTLQRYSETLDGGEILVEKPVDISDASTWRAVRRKQYQETVSVLATAVSQFASGAELGTTVSDLGPVYRPSDRTCSTVLQYLPRTVLGWIKTGIQSL